ncbi:hypothetical protein [Halomarina litorea]|uniref:hypothetical protein n=1 Tax=Halomarina litorea TaxID=2961595 RepID=UPI0020C43200|nr:hypothetical protein [Halomarina sp. BCD28]
MPSTTRRALLASAASGGLLLAGCSTSPLSESESGPTYQLVVRSFDGTLSEAALWSPGSPFDDTRERALDTLFESGSVTATGYEPVPDGVYVERDGTYYEVATVLTGRERVERPVVRFDALPEEESESVSATRAESLPRVDERVAKILHVHERSGGSHPTDLLDDGGYVLRYPAEREGAYTASDPVERVRIHGRVYRVRVATETLAEPVYTAHAIEVAGTEAAFADVATASIVDETVDPATLPEGARDLFRRALAADGVKETRPFSDAFAALLDVLGLGDEATNGRHVLYGGEPYRYALYVND